VRSVVQRGAPPSKKRAVTVFVVFGMVSWFASACGSSGPTKLGEVGGSGVNSPKNAANCQNWSRLYAANGWSWHWAHSSFTPRKARVTVAASVSGFTSFA
jgi:hypothetical protein